MKIQTKIVLTYILLTTLVVVGLGALLSVQFESYYTSHLAMQLETQARFIMHDLRQDPPQTLGDLDSRVKQLAVTGGIRITLIDRNGVVIEDSDVDTASLARVENHLLRPEVQEALRTGHGVKTRRSATVKRNFLYVALRIDAPASSQALASLAILRVSMHLEDVETAVADIRSQILVAGIMTFLVVLIVSIFISRRISKPIVAIAQSVNRIRAGDLQTKIAIVAPKEIGEVAVAVNELVDKLNSDIVRLKKLEQMRSEFLGNVSHELRTPIFSMQGFLETLLDGAIDDPRVNRTFLSKALNQSRRLNSLLRDLIEISRIESGEMKLSFRYFDVNPFLDQVIADTRPIAESRGIALHVQHADGDPQAFGDKERLKQVLMNLIENAIKYNSAAGSVTVAVVQNGAECVRLSVSDTGIGIPPEHIDRVFERFYRVDKERSHDAGGTGLGLAIVKHIVEAHGSKMEVVSTPGQGSRFSFDLKK
jgi:two-component system, OmpR family, phosphate regulon sensor histidine kinase PhoR